MPFLPILGALALAAALAAAARRLAAGRAASREAEAAGFRWGAERFPQDFGFHWASPPDPEAPDPGPPHHPSGFRFSGEPRQEIRWRFIWVRDRRRREPAGSPADRARGEAPDFRWGRGRPSAQAPGFRWRDS